MLVDGNLEIPQGGAIMRHLARKHGLYGNNNDEATRCDVAYEARVDLIDKIISLAFSEDFVSTKNSPVSVSA